MMSDSVWATLGYQRPQWWKLPISLRQRYWIETVYDRKLPSEALVVKIESALNTTNSVES